jgi:S-adenosylmethionine hydrolase
MVTKPLIVLLTDYGAADAFAGILKGVMAGIYPDVSFTDLTHEIPPGDIQRAALLLWQASSYFPPGTIFLCVVDPGVGTTRRGIIVESGERIFVGPDNGIFTFVLQKGFQAWEISNPGLALPYPSNTFHGRDIFAPAAAYLALGRRALEFGPQVLDPLRLKAPRLEFSQPDTIQGEILSIDRFGNLLTSLGRFERLDGDRLKFVPWLEEQEDRSLLAGISGLLEFDAQDSAFEVLEGMVLLWAKTFADIPEDRCAVLLGSSGLLEIAANRRSAARLLDLRPGDPVTLRIRGEVHG